MFKLYFVLLLGIVATATLLEAAGINTVLKCTRPNEEYQCGSACQTTCAKLGEPCPIVNIRCNDACYCINGFARDNSGKCIPIANCPPKRGY